jgi:hypothetical protein
VLSFVPVRGVRPKDPAHRHKGEHENCEEFRSRTLARTLALPLALPLALSLSLSLTLTLTLALSLSLALPLALPLTLSLSLSLSLTLTLTLSLSLGLTPSLGLALAPGGCMLRGRDVLSAHSWTGPSLGHAGAWRSHSDSAVGRSQPG